MSAQIASSVFLFHESVFVLLMVQTIALCNQRICFQRNEVRIRVHRTGDLLYIIAVTDIFEDFLIVQGHLRGEHIRFIFHPAFLHIEDVELFEAACFHGFLSVQNIVSDLVEHAKSVLMKNHNKGKRRVGRMHHTTAFGRLMICQCGNKFNLRFHSRDGRTDGVDYQCYTSVNRGSVAKRLNKGISIEHSCESPYIQGWKLEMMAEQVFDRYIENADKVMDLSYTMLEKHIADQKELPDNTDVIQRKQGEIEKLMNKRTNLIEMRAEGDIDKEMFRSKKQEIEERVAKLTEEIKGLQPEKEPTSNEDYSAKLLELRKRLKEYTGFDYSVIPESIVEAFIERIWVSKDEFRWYLRTGNKVEGEFDPDDHIKIGSFTLTIADAKKYIYSFSTRRRVYKWVDLNVSVWI